MEDKKILMKKALADELVDLLACVYLSAITKAKNIEDIHDLVDSDFEAANNYARSKFLGITSEFELNGYEWCIIDK